MRSKPYQEAAVQQAVDMLIFRNEEITSVTVCHYVNNVVGYANGMNSKEVAYALKKNPRIRPKGYKTVHSGLSGTRRKILVYEEKK